MLFWSKSLHQDRRTVKLSHYNTYKMYDIGVRVHFNALAWVRLSAIRRIGGWLRCRPRLPLLDTDGTLGYHFFLEHWDINHLLFLIILGVIFINVFIIFQTQNRQEILNQKTVWRWTSQIISKNIDEDEQEMFRKLKEEKRLGRGRHLMSEISALHPFYFTVLLDQQYTTVMVQSNCTGDGPQIHWCNTLMVDLSRAKHWNQVDKCKNQLFAVIQKHRQGPT